MRGQICRFWGVVVVVDPRYKHRYATRIYIVVVQCGEYYGKFVNGGGGRFVAGADRIWRLRA